MLGIACGAAKNKFPWLKKVVGIAIDAPKFAERNSEDFLLLDCERWSAKESEFYAEANKITRFFETDSLSARNIKISDFPQAEGSV